MKEIGINMNNVDRFGRQQQARLFGIGSKAIIIHYIRFYTVTAREFSPWYDEERRS